MRLSNYWRCQLIGWISYIGIQLMLASLLDRYEWKMTLFLVIISVIGLVVTHFLRKLIHQYHLKTWPIKRLMLWATALLPLLSVAMTAIAYFISQAMASRHAAPQPSILEMLLQLSINWILVFLIWYAIYFAVAFFKRYNQAEVEKWKMKALLNDTELQALRAQINPHFMFNCLTSACALTIEDPPKAQRVLTRLSDLLRHALATGEQPMVSVAQELSVTRKYLELESIRLEDRLAYHIDVGEESKQAQIPAMMMQMLVENGIKHGVALRPQGGRLEIDSDLSQKHLHIRIRNSGRLTDEIQQGHGLGTKNVRDRLKLLYGDRAHFSLKQTGQEWVTAELQIPLEVAS